MYSMMMMLAGAVFNVVFDPVFLFVFDMGIAGIAWATTLGQMLSSAIAVYYFINKFHVAPLTRDCFKLQISKVAPTLALGAAASINQLAQTVAQVTQNNILSVYGASSEYGSEIPLAAVGAVSKFVMLSMAIVIGFSQGSQTINSFNYGAKQYGRVKKSFLWALSGATIVSILVFLCFQIFPRQLMMLFGEGEPLYHEFAIKYMRIFLLMTALNGIVVITADFFTSIGKARSGFLIAFTRQLVFLIPTMLALTYLFGLSGFMWSGPLADTLAMLLALSLAIKELKSLSRLDKHHTLSEIRR